MAKLINEQDGEVKRMFTASSIMLTVNEHSMQLNRAIDERRREYEILIDAIMNTQKGVLKLKLNSVALVRERTIPTERPPPVGEVSANFCG